MQPYLLQAKKLPTGTSLQDPFPSSDDLSIVSAAFFLE
jgi:hypothetical protein